MNQRILGIDYGLKRIGLALSDAQCILSSPLTTLEGEATLEKTVTMLINYLNKDQKERNYHLKKIVVGLPLHMDGQEGAMADQVRSFGQELQRQSGIHVLFFDERLSSAQADRFLKQAQFNRKKRARFVDKLSAVLILQSFLDSSPKNEVD